MKRKIVRLFSLIFVFTFFTSVLPTANATSMRASDYFAYTDTCATPLGNGTVAFEFDINATHTMQKLGAETIYIWEEQSNGNFEVVKTYSGGMLSTNTAAAYGRLIIAVLQEQITTLQWSSMLKIVMVVKNFIVILMLLPLNKSGEAMLPPIFFTPSDIRRPTAPCGTSWDPCCPPWRTATPG